MNPRLGLTELPPPQPGQVLRQSPTGTWRWVNLGPPATEAEARARLAELRRLYPGREFRIVPIGWAE